ncbi:hypothetical protein MesoLj131c_16380 [Mesorhizobium sp. 131-3-5]|uniref:hypothetical protein n=1 Tax=Mesorhizobium sp. 131-3-5 TaxID=2744520 RepID=UPI001927B852|nr:hypothetical protein [Mesorhizobium sp. 131-3-5]BCH07380.1 hypothetical protein MesoLj131c_16380 [Mesorhizobium sp. 131-3-5]
MSESRFRGALKRLGLADDTNVARMAASLTWEVALAVDPEWEAGVPDKDFLGKVLGSNPSYTGWPIWLDSRSFNKASSRPEVHGGAWEAIIASTSGDWAHLDFMRLDPRGRFYLRRALQDDLTLKVAPGTALDPITTITRVAEAIAVGIAIANALIGGEGEPRRLGFAFRWRGLADRVLKTWANPEVMMIGEPRAHDNEVSTYVELLSDTPVSAIAPAVQNATRDLFALFDGEMIPPNLVEDWSNRLIERRLT